VIPVILRQVLNDDGVSRLSHVTHSPVAGLWSVLTDLSLTLLPEDFLLANVSILCCNSIASFDDDLDLTGVPLISTLGSLVGFVIGDSIEMVVVVFPRR
jgi:hypothetical protein